MVLNPSMYMSMKKNVYISLSLTKLLTPSQMLQILFFSFTNTRHEYFF